jgi:hypothetical protein
MTIQISPAMEPFPDKGAVLLIRDEEGESTPYLVESTDPHARTVVLVRRDRDAGPGGPK